MAEAKAKDKGFKMEKPTTVDEDKDGEEPEGFDSVNLKEEEKVLPIKFETETFFSIAKRKCKHFFTNITLEPVMLFYGIVGSIDRVASSQLLFDKTCYNDFNFTDEICNDLQQHKENETSVGNEVAQFQVYESIVDHLFPIICSFFLGSWSDTFGRKYLLYFYFLMRLVEGSAMLLNAHFMAWPKEFLLFTVNLPVALSGGYITYSMGVAAFITEISTPEQRTFRLAMIHFISSLGSPIGTKIGAMIWDGAGDMRYTAIFAAGLGGKAITLVFLVARLELFKWNPGRVETEKEDRPVKRRNAFSLSHIKDSLMTCFKKRPDGKRFYLLLYTAVMLTIFLPFFGEHIISFNYVRKRYNWGVMEYSDYNSICRIIDLVGQSVLIPLLGYLELCDTNVIPVIICTIIARHAIKGFANESYLLYVGSAVDMMGGYSFSAARSAVTKCVELDELGKVFALLYSIESIVPMAMSQVYASLWMATSAVPGVGETVWVGSCFFLSAILTTVALALSIIGWCRLGGKDISALDKTPQAQPSYRTTKEPTTQGASL